MARLLVRSEHEGRHYFGQDAVTGDHHPAGAPPARPNRPTPDGPDPTAELLDKIDAVVLAVGGTTATAAVTVLEFPQAEPVVLQEVA